MVHQSCIPQLFIRPCTHPLTHLAGSGAQYSIVGRHNTPALVIFTKLTSSGSGGIGCRLSRLLELPLGRFDQLLGLLDLSGVVALRLWHTQNNEIGQLSEKDIQVPMAYPEQQNRSAL